MWVIDDKYGTLLVNMGDLTYMGEPLIIIELLSQMLAGDQDLPQTSSVLTSNGYLNYHCQNVLKETKSHFFCLFSYCRFNFYQCFANQRLAFYYNKEIKPHKQSLKQHKTARRYRSAYINGLES